MKLKLIICSAAVGMLAVSCFDDKYDLDDIDTTSRIEVKDLVVPVNFSDVLLSDIMHLKDDSDIKVIENDGSTFYAVSRTGTFTSKKINIKQPEADATGLEQKTSVLSENNGSYALQPLDNEFTFECDDVDKSIVTINSVKIADLDFSFVFYAQNVRSGKYENVRLQLPKAMTGSASAGTYDASNGVWTIPSLSINSDGEASAVFTANSIDFSKNEGFAYENPVFTFTSHFGLLDGSLLASAGSTVNFTADFRIGHLIATAVTGEIKYELEGMVFDPINFDDLPKFLQGEGTDISLVNPLICLQTTNPVAADNLKYSANLKITPMRGVTASAPLTSSTFTVDYDKGNKAKYNTVLSPERPDYVPADYEGYLWFVYNNLGNILAGDGMPSALNIDVENPEIPRQPVNNFSLGEDIDGVVGSYEFFAPLALKDGSTIYYSDTKDGWNKDIEYMTIRSLSISAKAVNNIPLEATVSMIPIDLDGNEVQNITIIPVELAAGTAEQDVKFVVKANSEEGFSNLDGVRFKATVLSTDEETLSPDLTIVLKDVRATIDGYYEKEL